MTRAEGPEWPRALLRAMAWIPLGLWCGGAIAVLRAMASVAELSRAHGLDTHAALWSVAQGAPALFLRAFVTGLVAAALVAGRSGDDRERSDPVSLRVVRFGFAAALFTAALVGWPAAGPEAAAGEPGLAPDPDGTLGAALIALGWAPLAGLALAALLLLATSLGRTSPVVRGATHGPLAVLVALALAVAAPAVYAWRQARRPPSMVVGVHVGRLWAAPLESASEDAAVPSVAWIDPLDAGPGGSSARPALVAPAPWRVRLRLPPGGSAEEPLFLEARMGLGDADVPVGVRVHFEVSVDGELVERTVLAAGTRAGWRLSEPLQNLPLLPGSEIVLSTTLESDATGPAPRAAFADLVLAGRYRRPRAAGGRELPNLVVVVVDGLRADHGGGGSAPPIETPALAGLAARGLSWTEACAASTRPAPALASILTGRPVLAHGMAGGRPRLAPELETLAEVLQREGYTTAAFSGSAVMSTARGFDQGFETFEDALGAPPAAALVERALDWIRRWRAARFHVHLHLGDLTGPLRPDPAILARVAGEPPDDLPADVDEVQVLEHYARLLDGGLDPRAIPPRHLTWMRAVYAATVASVDAALDRLLAGLEAAGLEDSTVVAVTAGHGFELGERGRLGWGHDLGAVLVHVPLVLAGPGVPRAGELALPVGNRHLAPTLARLAGVELADATDARSLLVAPAAGEAGGALAALEDGVFEGRAGVDLLRLRSGPWSLLVAPDFAPDLAPGGSNEPSLTRGVQRLFRVADDPLERIDRLARDPDVAAELWQQLELLAARAVASRPPLVPWAR